MHSYVRDNIFKYRHSHIHNMFKSLTQSLIQLKKKINPN